MSTRQGYFVSILSALVGGFRDLPQWITIRMHDLTGGQLLVAAPDLTELAFKCGQAFLFGFIGAASSFAFKQISSRFSKKVNTEESEESEGGEK